jgi:hypothetical protein
LPVETAPKPVAIVDLEVGVETIVGSADADVTRELPQHTGPVVPDAALVLAILQLKVLSVSLQIEVAGEVPVAAQADHRERRIHVCGFRAPELERLGRAMPGFMEPVSLRADLPDELDYTQIPADYRSRHRSEWPPAPDSMVRSTASTSARPANGLVRYATAPISRASRWLVISS